MGREWSWRLWAVAAVVVVGLAVVVPSWDGGRSRVRLGAIADAGSSDSLDARRSARRFVRALREGDGPRACAVASARHRADPASRCAAAGYTGYLAGPTPKVGVPRVAGDHARVRVSREPAPVLVLSLVRERGAWLVDRADGL